MKKSGHKQKAPRKKKYRGVLYPVDWMEMSKEARYAWRMGIDSVKGPEDEYRKSITAIYNGPHDITFKKEDFKRLQTITYRKTVDELAGDDTDHFYLKDVEAWKVFDPIRYNNAELQGMVKDFLEAHDDQKL